MPFPVPTTTLLLALLVVALPARGQAVGAADVRAAALEALGERYPEDAHRFEVRVSRTSGAEAPEALRVRFDGAEVPRAHARVALLDGSDAAGWREIGWALLYVAHFDSVAVARLDLGRGEAVPADGLGFSWVETTRFRGVPLRPDDYRALAASGEVFAERTLREGGPVRAGDLRGAYAADTGEAVTMRYRRGELVLTLRCKAREPGVAGEVVRLYAPDTRSTYRARLTGPGTAEWVETL